MQCNCVNWDQNNLPWTATPGSSAMDSSGEEGSSADSDGAFDGQLWKAGLVCFFQYGSLKKPPT